MIGKTIGQYRIEEKLGEGAMGVVFRARQVSLQRDVALKLLPSHLALQENALARFQREATAIARIAHPNIVQVIDIGEDNGRHYIAMEFIEGRTLEQVLKDAGPMPIRDAVHVVAQVAAALGAAHEQGIIHRDVKPSNILVNGRLFAKLTDFGVAALSEGGGDSRLTMTMAAVGTPYYMSPEQVRGRDALDGASDVYAAGVLLYEMLAGQHPFAASTPTEAMMQQVNDPYPPLRRYRDGVPEELLVILQRCLSKEKDARYANGQALYEALDKVRLRLDFETLEGGGGTGAYRVEATGTGFFYVDPAARQTWQRKATIKKVVREAWAQLTDPHRRHRRKLGQLYASSMVSRDAMKSLETHIEELKRRQAHHEKKASESRQLAQDHVSDGRGDEASDASEQESFHAKLALDYEQQIDRAGRDASSYREAYHRLKKEHAAAADSLALLDSKATGIGRCIPVGHEDEKLSRHGRRLAQVASLAILAGIILAGVGCYDVFSKIWSAWSQKPRPLALVAPTIQAVPAVPPVGGDAGGKQQVDATPQLSDGLVLQCDFEKNADDKSGKNHGVIRGEARWVDGVSGHALEMSDKSSWIEFPRHVLNPRSGDWSISIWLKLKPGVGDNEAMVMSVANAQGPGFGGAIWYQLSAAQDSHTGQLLFGMRSDAQNSQTVCRSIMRLDDNQWHHLNLVRRARTTLEFWVDGKLVNSVTNPRLANVDVELRDSYGSFDSALPAFIGYAPAYDGSWLNGSIDSLRIYNRSLSPDEIRMLHTQHATASEQKPLTEPGIKRGLLAYYSFTEDEGTRVSDQSGMKREGSVVNADWTADGRVGGAMRFGPSNSYVVASDAGLPMGNAPRSIAFWMKLDNKLSAGNAFAYGPMRYNQACMLGMDWRLGRNSIAFSQWGAVNVAAPKFEANRWYHIIYTYNGQEHAFHIDGARNNLAVREIGRSINTTSTGNLYIGSAGPEVENAFDGWIDEVMIYDRALEPAEARQLYDNSGPGINPAGGLPVAKPDRADSLSPVAPLTPAAGGDLRRGIFFVAGDNLYRMNMDGTDCIVVATGASGSRELVADPASNMIYMTTWDHSQILGYDVATGVPIRQLHNGLGSGGQGLGYDPALSKFFVGLYYRGVYVLDAQQSDTWQHIVKPAEISPMLGQRGQLQLDVKNQHAYFRTAYNGYTPDPLRFIWRVNYDGTGLIKIIRANDGDGLALDLPAGHLYFTDGDQSSQFIEIKRANLDGTDSQTILKLSPLPYHYGQSLELDLENRKMYMYLTVGARSDAPPRWDDRAIGRANLDGSGFELLWQKPGIGGGGGLAIFTP